MILIPGFKFCPSDRVLLSYYLLKRLKGEPTAYQIPEIDVYGIEPWRLFKKPVTYDSDDEDEAMCSNNVIYVFTAIKKKHGNGERIDRTVTSLSSSSKNQVVGTWKGQTTQTEIKNKISNKIVGVKKMFSFIPTLLTKQDHDEDIDEGRNGKNRKSKITNDDDQLDGISYIMHEYSMVGACYVLCRIRRKIDKKKMSNKKMKHNQMMNTSVVVPYPNQILMRQQQQPVQSAAAVVPYPNQILMRQQQQPVQSAAAMPGGLPDDDLQNLLMSNFC